MPVPGSLILFHISFAAESFCAFVFCSASGSAVSAIGSIRIFFKTERGVSLLFGYVYYVWFCWWQERRIFGTARCITDG